MVRVARSAVRDMSRSCLTTTLAYLCVRDLSCALLARCDRLGIERWGHCDLRTVDPAGTRSVAPFAFVF
jgi:hypothetical protein